MKIRKGLFFWLEFIDLRVNDVFFLNIVIMCRYWFLLNNKFFNIVLLEFYKLLLKK